MIRSENEILKVILTRKNWRVKLEVEFLAEHLCQSMEGREGVEINQVQEIETLSGDATIIVMGVVVLKCSWKLNQAKFWKKVLDLRMLGVI